MIFSLCNDDITKLPVIYERTTQEVFLWLRWVVQKNKEIEKQNRKHGK